MLNILWGNLESAQVDFMRNLMIRLGLLVPLNEDSTSSSSGKRFVAPNIITTEDDDEEKIVVKMDQIDTSVSQTVVNDDGLLDETFEIKSKMDDHAYMPNGFVERIVAKMMPFSVPYTENTPSIYVDVPSFDQISSKGKIVIAMRIQDGNDIAEIRLSSRYNNVITCSICRPAVGGSDNSTTWTRHASHLVALANEVNEDFFQNRLTIDNSRREEIGGSDFQTTYRSSDAAGSSCNVGAAQPPKPTSAASTEDSSIATDELYQFFVSECGIKESSAREICKNLDEEEDIDKVQQLQNELYDSQTQFKTKQTESEFEELLKRVKCKRVHLTGIKNGLQSRVDKRHLEQKTKEAEVPFVLIVTGGENLKTHEETKLILSAFVADAENRKAEVLNDNDVESMSEALSSQRAFKMLHFAMHGTVGRDGKRTLAMRTSKDISTLRNPEQLGNIIKASGAEINAIVLNICQGAKSAKDFIRGGNYVVGWSSDVADDAAILFAKLFYSKLKDGKSTTNPQTIFTPNFKKSNPHPTPTPSPSRPRCFARS